MTVLNSIPASGIYFQQGAIIELVCQIVDVNTISPTNPNGDPFQLQSANGFTISILYPDGVTTQTFVASLYTDGSDGMVTYTTRNSGSNVDLSQIGLYEMQASAIVGGVQLPPSLDMDFYVNPNVEGISTTPLFNSSALIMFDSSGVRWAGTIVTGAITFAAQPTGPASFLEFNALVMQDTNGAYWTIGISTLGVQTGITGGSFQNALQSFILTDSTGHAWVITVNTSGKLQAA